MALAAVSFTDGKPFFLDLTNKLSYLSNGKGCTGYHNLRRKDLSAKGAKHISYLDVLDLYKESPDDSDFDDKLLGLIRSS